MKRILTKSERSWILPFYTALQKLGLRFVRLEPFSKTVPKGTTWEQNVVIKADDVIDVLGDGYNIGILLAGKGGKHANNIGLFVVDKDSSEAEKYCDFSPFTFLVTHGHPDKGHYYALMADTSFPRKSRFVRGSHDVKLTGIVVGPGSHHKDGRIYMPLMREPGDAVWKFWGGAERDLQNLPRLNPADFMALGRFPILKKKE